MWSASAFFHSGYEKNMSDFFEKLNCQETQKFQKSIKLIFIDFPALSNPAITSQTPPHPAAFHLELLPLIHSTFKSKSSRFYYTSEIVSLAFFFHSDFYLCFVLLVFCFVFGFIVGRVESCAEKLKDLWMFFPSVNFSSHFFLLRVANNRIIQTTNSRVFRWDFGGR